MEDKPNVTVIYQTVQPDAKPAGCVEWLVCLVGIAIFAGIFVTGRHW